MASDASLSTRCSLPGLSLWFGRAELRADRVRLRGWTWRGLFERDVPLESIERVKWWAVTDDVNFLLHLHDGRVVPMQLHRNAGTWNYELRKRLGLEMLAQSDGTRVGRSRKQAA